MKVLGKARCVESSFERSDRDVHALISSAQLGSHLFLLQHVFPSRGLQLQDQVMKGLLPLLVWQETTTLSCTQELCHLTEPQSQRGPAKSLGDAKDSEILFGQTKNSGAFKTSEFCFGMFFLQPQKKQ